jgi:hypothetical protein
MLFNKNKTLRHYFYENGLKFNIIKQVYMSIKTNYKSLSKKEKKEF